MMQNVGENTRPRPITAGQALSRGRNKENRKSAADAGGSAQRRALEWLDRRVSAPPYCLVKGKWGGIHVHRVYAARNSGHRGVIMPQSKRYRVCAHTFR